MTVLEIPAVLTTEYLCNQIRNQSEAPCYRRDLSTNFPLEAQRRQYYPFYDMWQDKNPGRSRRNFNLQTQVFDL